MQDQEVHDSQLYPSAMHEEEPVKAVMLEETLNRAYASLPPRDALIMRHLYQPPGGCTPPHREVNFQPRAHDQTIPYALPVPATEQPADALVIHPIKETGTAYQEEVIILTRQVIALIRLDGLQVGAALGVTARRIGQIQQSCLQDLREHFGKELQYISTI